MANCITIAKGMQFWGTHGFFPEENKFGAKFVVDITAESDETGKCQNDDYSTGVSYLTLYNCAKKVVTTEQHKWCSALRSASLMRFLRPAMRWRR